MLERMVGVPYEYSSFHLKHVPINPCMCSGVQFHVVGLDGLEGMLETHKEDWWGTRAEQDVSEALWLTPNEVLDFAIARPIPVAMFLPPVMGELFGIFLDPARPFPMQGLTLHPTVPAMHTPPLEEQENESLDEDQNLRTPHDGQQRARGLSHA